MSDRLTDSMTQKSLLEHLVTQQINKIITVHTHNVTAQPERNSREKQRTEQNSMEQRRVTVATGIFPKKLIVILTNDNPGGMTSPEHEPERNNREKQIKEQNNREQKTQTTEAPAAKKPRQAPKVSVATGIFPKKMIGILTNDNPGGMTSPELMPPPASRASERQTHLFECPQCKKKFPTENRMMYHLEKHT